MSLFTQLRGLLLPSLLLPMAVGLPVTPSTLGAEDWPRFRGPDAGGIAAAKNLIRTWPEGGPAVVWRRPLGEGFSGVAVVGDRLYTQFAEGEDEVAASFQTSDGTEIWRRRIGETFVDQWGNGPRATPSVDGETVYVLSSDGLLQALATRDGQPRWRMDLSTFFGPDHVPATGEGPFWGHCASPLVEGDLLIVPTGVGDGKSLVALDKTSGEVRWSLFDHPITQSSPIAMTLGGQRQVVISAAGEIVGVSLEGKALWRFPWGRFTIALPLQITPNRIFFSSPNDVGAIVIELEPTNQGFSVHEIWREPHMRNNWQTSVAHHGSIVGFDNATLKSLSEDGEIQWAKRGLGKGTVILAGDLLVLLSDRGLLTLARWSTKSFQELGRMPILSGTTWTSPSVAGGRLYLRNHEELICLDLRG